MSSPSPPPSSSPSPKPPPSPQRPPDKNPFYYLVQGMLTLPPAPQPPPPSHHPPRKQEDPPQLHRSAVLIAGCTKDQTAEMQRQMQEGTDPLQPLEEILDKVVARISDSHGVFFRINKKLPEPGGEYAAAAKKVFTTVVNFHDKFEELMDLTWNLATRVYDLVPPSFVKNPSPSFDDPSAPKPSVEWWLMNKEWLPDTGGVPGNGMIAFLPSDGGSGIEDLPPVGLILKGLWDSLEKPENVAFGSDGSMRLKGMTNKFFEAFLMVQNLKKKAYAAHVMQTRRSGSDAP